MNSSKDILSLFFIGALLFTASCGSKGRFEPKTGVIASIGGMEILASELQSEIARRQSKGLEASPEKVLEEIVGREVLVARARQLGVDQEPEVVSGYKRLLIARLKELELEPALRKAEEPMEGSDPGRSPGQRAEPPQIPQIRFAILRQTVVPTTSASKFEQIMSRMTEVRDRATQLPASEIGFGTLAIDNSDDQSSRYRGGDLGWMIEEVGKLRYDRAMLEAAFALKSAGEISPLIRGRDGLYLVRLVARRTIQKHNATATEAAFVSQYRSRISKRKELERAFEESARTHVEVLIFREHMPEISTVAEARPVAPPSL